MGTTTADPQLPERAAQNQSRFRAYNERIEPHNRAHTWTAPPMPDWVCECAFLECVVPVRMTIAEYEAVRADPTHFFVATSDEHVIPKVERVIERNERYWVVEKVGDAGDMAETLDPRSGDAAPFDMLALRADQAAWNVAAPRT